MGKKMSEEDWDKKTKKYWNPKTHRWEWASRGTGDTRKHPGQFTSETAKQAAKAKKKKHAGNGSKATQFNSETGREAARKRWGK